MRKICKRGLSVVLALTLMVSLLTFGVSAAEYADMPTGWSHAAMEAAVDNGLLQGNNGKLDPEGLLTRAQLATMVTRAFGAAEEADLAAYTDVKANDWYASALAKALAMGVMNGTSAATMSPEQYVTRQEVFVILARALQLEDGTAEELADFTDAASVSAWAVGGTAAMVKSGCIKGSNGLLLPQERITREQFAQILYNIFAAYYREAGTYTGDVDGSLMISVPDVTVKNATIHGDLVIGDGVGEGDVTLDNVTVEGRVVVRGGGVNSIHIFGSRVGTIVISKANGNVRVAADSASSIMVVYIADGRDDVVIEGKVDTIVVEAASTPVVLKNATVNTVQVNADNAEVSLTGKTKVGEVAVSDKAEGVQLNTDKNASVGTLTADSDVTVDNSGSIGSIEGSGAAADKKGEEVKPAPSTGSSSGGHRHSYADEWTTDETHHWHIATCSHTEQKGSYGEHKYTTVVSDTATCTEAGTRVMSCVCGKMIEEASPAKGHSFSEAWSSDETDHWHTSTCGHDVTADKAAHTWNDGKVTTKATCTEAGVMTYTCTACGATKTEPIAALGHDFATKYAKDANGHWHECSRCTATDDKTPHTYPEHDCDEAAYCSECGYKKAAGSHAWGEGVVTTAPTCTEKGVMTYTCTVCDATKTEPIAALGHDFTTEYTKDANGHWHVCSRCDATDKTIAHSYDKTSCAEAASCTVCGYVKPAGEHTWNAGKVTTKATCDEAGVMTYTCTACGATKTEPIAALGHTEAVDAAKAPTCTEAGLTEGKHCSVCGTVLVTQTVVPATGHTYATTLSYDDTYHWHAATCGHTAEVKDKAAHSYDADGKCVCGAVKASTPVVGEYDYTLAYAEAEADDYRNGLLLTFSPALPAIPVKTGHYELHFYGVNDEHTHWFWDADDCSELDHMFAGHDAKTFTRVELVEVVDENETLLARLDKSLTTSYSGSAINITDLTVDDENEETWDVTFTTDVTLDGTREDYVLYEEHTDGDSSCGYIWFENGVARTNIYKDEYTAGETVTLYLMKVTHSLDADGNATLTYTHMGSGYRWTVPGESSSGGSDTPEEGAYTMSYVKQDTELAVTFDPALPDLPDEKEYQLKFYDVYSDTYGTDGAFQCCFQSIVDYLELGQMFMDSVIDSGEGVSYTRVALYEYDSEPNSTTFLGRLDKSLETVVSGDAISITGIVASENEYSEDNWDVTLTVDKALGSDAKYVLVTSYDDGGRLSSDIWSDWIDGTTVQERLYMGEYTVGETVTLYLVEIAATVDADGNATLTYTPMGDGYRWTVALSGNGGTDDPDTPVTGEYDYTLAYTEKWDHLWLGCEPSPSPDTAGYYMMRFYDANGSVGTSFGATNAGFAPCTMFVGEGERVYTRVEMLEVVDDTEAVLGRLDKTLTTVYSGDVINITNIEVTDSEREGRWNATITTDVALDYDATYVICEHPDNRGFWTSTVSGYDGNTVPDTISKAKYANGGAATFYIMKTTYEIDADGNATLTYTPMGDGYSWTAPEA